jgi:GT2 family glycosyltransferase
MKEKKMLQRVTVIIVNWNGRNYIDQCLMSLRKQTFKDFKVCLVDNNSSDDSVKHIRKNYPEIKIIEHQTNTGFAIANNIAIENTNSEFIATLNNDAVAHPNWLFHLVSILEKNKSAGFAASKMLFWDFQEYIDRAGDVYTYAGAGGFRGRGLTKDQLDKEELIFGACAGAAIYRREMLKVIGLFDGNFFLLFEDVDLSFRAQLQGYKCIYSPNAIVYHMGSKSIVHDSNISIYYAHRNIEWVFIKNMPTKLLFVTIIPHIIYNFSALLYFFLRGKKDIFLKAKWHAFKGFKKNYYKRKNIQSNRKVNCSYMLSIFNFEFLINRMKHRLSNLNK